MTSNEKEKLLYEVMEQHGQYPFSEFKKLPNKSAG